MLWVRNMPPKTTTVHTACSNVFVSLCVSEWHFRSVPKGGHMTIDNELPRTWPPPQVLSIIFLVFFFPYSVKINTHAMQYWLINISPRNRWFLLLFICLLLFLLLLPIVFNTNIFRLFYIIDTGVASITAEFGKRSRIIHIVKWCRHCNVQFNSNCHFSLFHSQVHFRLTQQRWVDGKFSITI